MRRLALSAALLALGPVLACCAGPAQAAGCPNEAIREEQHATYLPDCRAYELVSLPDSNGNQVLHASGPAPDGEAILYNYFGGVAAGSTGAKPLFRAARGADGWQSTSLLPPAGQLFAENYAVTAATPDLTRQVATSFHGLSQASQTPSAALVRLEGGGQALLHTFPEPYGTNGGLAIASNDLAHVYANVPEPIDPSQQPGTRDLYDFGTGSPELVSRMPATGEAPRCGVSTTGVNVDAALAVFLHWTSVDGNRIFFPTVGDVLGCSGPEELYLRDRNSETTTLVSGPPLFGDPDLGIDTFVGAAADGSWVVYRTATSLDPADAVDGNNTDRDLYRWDAATDTNTCLTCVVQNAEVSASLVMPDAVVSEDGSRLYFTSVRQYAGAPAAGNVSDPSDPLLNTYVLSGGQLHYIAQTNGIAARTRDGGDLTPGGQVLIFRSHATDLNALSGSDNGGFDQFYRYDDRDNSLTCLSCPPGHAATAGVPGELQTANGEPVPFEHVVSADGETVAFPAEGALLPEDENGSRDIYVWQGGNLGLVSDGRSSLSKPQLDAVSSDGRDVFLLASHALTFDSVAGPAKLYDARIDGGFPRPALPPSPCQGEGCLRGAALPPGPPAIASEATGSTGNLVAKRARHHRHRHRHHHRSHRSHAHSGGSR